MTTAKDHRTPENTLSQEQRDKLVLDNLGAAYWIAKRVAGDMNDHDLEDVTAYVVTMFIRASQLYDPDNINKAKFLSYTMKKCMRAATGYKRKLLQRGVKVPDWVFNTTKGTSMRQLGRISIPSVSDLFISYDTNSNDYTTSLDKSNIIGDTKFTDKINKDDSIDRLRSLINKFLRYLTKRQRKIIELSFLIPPEPNENVGKPQVGYYRTSKAIALILGTSRQNVHYGLKAALGKLRLLITESSKNKANRYEGSISLIDLLD